MPDEPAWAHAARWAWVNGLGRADSIFKQVSAGVEEERGPWVRSPSDFRLLAGDQSPGDYTRNHGMGGLLVRPQRLTYWSHQNWMHLFRHHAGFANGVRRLYTCFFCARNDVAERGFAWVRRGHQLAGVLWCPAHDVPLTSHKQERSFQAFGRNRLLSAMLLEPPPGAAELLSVSDFVRRYFEIMRWVCWPARPDRWWFVRELLCQLDRRLWTFEPIRRVLCERKVIEYPMGAATQAWFDKHLSRVLRSSTIHFWGRYPVEECGYLDALALACEPLGVEELVAQLTAVEASFGSLESGDAPAT